jgi:dienelactone hydrolase
MVEIVLFHHVCGMTDGVHAFAETLRETGHTVHTPDLFEGRTFTDVREGMEFAESVGEEVFEGRAAEVVKQYPTDAVYGGMSMGAARAAEQVLERPGARGAFFLYGAVAPSWWGATWPSDVATQAHVAEGDELREPEAETEYAEVPGAELFVYPAGGHLFAEPGHPDHDPDAARLATGRVLDFLATR